MDDREIKASREKSKRSRSQNLQLIYKPNCEQKWVEVSSLFTPTMKYFQIIKLQLPQFGVASLQVKNYAIFAGGKWLSKRKYSRNVYVVNYQSTPKHITQMLYAKYKFHLFHLQNPQRVISTGGFNLRPLNSTQVLSFDTQKWTKLPSLRVLYTGETSALVNNSVLYRFGVIPRMFAEELRALYLNRPQNNWTRCKLQNFTLRENPSFAFQINSFFIFTIKDSVIDIIISKNQMEFVFSRQARCPDLMLIRNGRLFKIYRGVLYFQDIHLQWRGVDLEKLEWI